MKQLNNSCSQIGSAYIVRSRGRPQNLLFSVVPRSPGGAGHFIYQLAEAAPKLKIKNIFDAVRALTR
jgi:hypothetical protein